MNALDRFAEFVVGQKVTSDGEVRPSGDVGPAGGEGMATVIVAFVLGLPVGAAVFLAIALSTSNTGSAVALAVVADLITGFVALMWMFQRVTHLRTRQENLSQQS